MTFEQHHFLAPIGWLEITATTDAITKLQIVPAPKQQLHSNNDIIIQCCNELKEYFEGKRKKFEVKVLYNGTIFQNNVWNQLQTIPYSTTIPYKTLAQMTGHPKAWRAVGSANGKNPIAIIVPCHRVIASNGNLGGYAYGLPIKEYLLKLEKENEY